MDVKRLVSVKPSTRKGKKYDAFFEYIDRKTGEIDVKKVSFGAEGYTDYTLSSLSKDPDRNERKERYINRHSREKELWKEPDNPASLSRWILWNLPTFQASLLDFRRRFGV